MGFLQSMTDDLKWQGRGLEPGTSRLQHLRALNHLAMLLPNKGSKKTNKRTQFKQHLLFLGRNSKSLEDDAKIRAEIDQDKNRSIQCHDMEQPRNKHGKLQPSQHFMGHGDTPAQSESVDKKNLNIELRR